MKNHRAEVAYQFLRIGLGISVFIHGLVRIGPKYQSFVTWTADLFKDSLIPAPLALVTGYCVPPIELAVGLCIIVGVLIVPALTLGTVLMFVLMTGMAVLQKWDVVGLDLIYILIYSGLFAFGQMNVPIWNLPFALNATMQSPK